MNFIIIIFLFILSVTWIEISTLAADKNLLNIQTLGVAFKENSYIINDRKHLKYVMVNNKYFDLDSTREEAISQSTYYNESITLSFLCYGINFTDHHILTWHHVIGGTEVERASIDSRKANNNYTLSLSMATFDNESVIFCTASVPSTGEIINRTKEFKFQMNGVLTEDIAIIAVCGGNFSYGSTKSCAIGNYKSKVIEVSKRRHTEYLTVGAFQVNNKRVIAYGYIKSAYYNEYFPTITHKCSNDDKSVLKTPDGRAQVNVNETFTFDKFDNGTVIFCSRIVHVLENLKPNEYKVERQTYNERIYVYNELYWKDSNYSVNLFIIVLVIGIIVIVIANVLGVIFCILRWIRKRRNPRKETSIKNENKLNIKEQLQDVCKWMKIVNNK